MTRQTLGKINVSISIDANLWWQLEDKRNSLSMHTIPNRSVFYEELLRKGLAYERLIKAREEEERRVAREYVEDMKKAREKVE